MICFLHPNIFNRIMCQLSTHDFSLSTSLMCFSRDAELEADDDLLIGPHWWPPTVVAEAASTNEAERFEEVHCQL
jgi:hypothetical protein